MFSKTSCSRCSAAKSLIYDVCLDPMVFEVDEYDDGPSIERALEKITGKKLPVVYIHGKYIKTDDELKRLFTSGEIFDLV